MSTSLPRPISRMSQAMIVLGLCAALVVAFVNLRETPPVRMVEGELLTARFLLRGPMAADQDIVLLQSRPGTTVGEADLAAAVTRLAGDGARSLVIDPSLLPLNGTREGEPSEGEMALAGALRDYGKAAVPYLFFATPAANDAQGKLPNILQRSILPLSPPQKSASRAQPLQPEGYRAPGADILGAGAPGFVIADPAADSAGRFNYPAVRYQGNYYPSLALAAARVDQGLPADALSLNAGDGLNIGSLFVPTDYHMRIAVNYRGPDGVYRSYALGDFLKGALDGDKFRGKLVILGAGTAGGGLKSPYSPSITRAAYLANVIDNLLHADPLERSQQVIVLDIILLGLIGLIFAVIAAARTVSMVLLFAGVATALILAVNIQAFILLNLWLGLAFPLLAVLLCTAVLVSTKMLSERRIRALTAQVEAEATQFAVPWTFDRVAKAGGEAGTEAPAPEPPEAEAETAEPLRWPEKTPRGKAEEPTIAANETEETEEARKINAPEPAEPEETGMDEEPEDEAEEARAPETAEETLLSDNVITPVRSRPERESGSIRPIIPKRARPSAAVIPMKRPDPARKPQSAAFKETPASAPVAPAMPQRPLAKNSTRPPVPEKSEPREAARRNTQTAAASSERRAEPATDSFPVAILYLGMAGFQALGEGFGPTRAAQFLHAVNRLIDKTVVKHHGVLEKFTEAGLVGLFGLPEESGAETENALRCGRELAATLSEWGHNQVLPRGGAMKFSIALHFGRVQVTAEGSSEAPEITLRGEALSFASAIDKAEAATNAAVVASTALVDEMLRHSRGEDLLKDMHECPEQLVPGRADPITLWRWQNTDDQA